MTTPTTLATTPRDQALNDVFTTALEGGIGYWSTCSVYRWGVTVAGRLEQARDFVAVVQDVEDEDGTRYISIRAARTRLAPWKIGHHLATRRQVIQWKRTGNLGKTWHVADQSPV